MVFMSYIYVFINKPIGTMSNDLRDLQRQQVDALLAPWRAAPLGTRPRAGWVRAIRDALGMSGAALARQLGMTHAGLRKLESAEASDAITLASLRKLAAALNCELHYALVPKTSLAECIENRAHAVAAERLRPVAHSMALEDQAVASAYNQLQIDQTVKALLEGSRRELW
jgi:predicted DNA-binding mobile mystery protein A